MTTTVETDRDAVRIAADVITQLLARDVPLTAEDAAEHVVRALLGTPTVTRRADGRLVVDWHDEPGHEPRAALVARSLLDELVTDRDLAAAGAARAAIDVILDTAVGIRDILHNPAARNAYAGRMFDEAARELDSLRAGWPRDDVRPPAGVLVVPARTTDEVLDALRASAGPHIEVRRTHPDNGDVVKYAGDAPLTDEQRADLAAGIGATPPAPWPDPEVAVDVIDHHTDEHLSPDCRAGKCGACIGGAWNRDLDDFADCTHPCHIPVLAAGS